MSQVHVHMRQRKTKNRKKTRTLAWFDRLVVAMGVANLFATMPQVLTIWNSKDATGVSSFSWGYYTVFAIVFLMYGILHKEKPIVASYTGSVVLFSTIFVGSLVY